MSDEPKKVRRSHSQLNLWFRCQRAYGYRYLQKLYDPPSWAMLGGIAVGDTIDKFHMAQIEGTTEFLSNRNLTGYLDATLDELSDKNQLPKSTEYTDARIDGGKLVPIYVTGVGQRMKPMAVQTEVNPTIEGVEHIGFIDLLAEEDEGTTIWDHKFTGRAPDANTASDSFQLVNYDIAFDDPTHKVGLIHLVRRKRIPQVMVRTHIVTPEDRGRLETSTRIMDTMVREGIWVPTNPTNWWCSEKHCSFWKHCRGRSGGPLPLPGEAGHVAPE